MENGIFILHKEQNMTSQTAVNRVKRLFHCKKAGHTGTLDPMATGVLPILLGNATRAGEFLLSSQKHYRAVLRLGITTDTEDTTGNILKEVKEMPEEEAVFAVLSRFRGEILQTPPMYSALKIGGKKLVDLARQGVTVERTPRPITVHRLEAQKLSPEEYSLDVVCSKGTYIRTLCNDIGEALGVGGCMAALCRVEAGGFSLEEAHTLSELEALSEEERDRLILPTEQIFSAWEKVVLPPFYSHLAHSGCPVGLKKVNLDLPIGQKVALYGENGFFAIAQVVAENRQIPEDGPSLQPIKQFPEAR